MGREIIRLVHIRTRVIARRPLDRRIPKTMIQEAAHLPQDIGFAATKNIFNLGGNCADRPTLRAGNNVCARAERGDLDLHTRASQRVLWKAATGSCGKSRSVTTNAAAGFREKPLAHHSDRRPVRAISKCGERHQDPIP